MNETLIERNCGAMRRFEIMKPASEKRTRAWAETRFSNFQLANSGYSKKRPVRAPSEGGGRVRTENCKI